MRGLGDLTKRLRLGLVRLVKQTPRENKINKKFNNLIGYPRTRSLDRDTRSPSHPRTRSPPIPTVIVHLFHKCPWIPDYLRNVYLDSYSK